MKDNRALVVGLLAGGALLLYAKNRSDRGLPLFGSGLGSLQGQSDPRFMAGRVGMQGTGNTNPIAAVLTGLSGAISKLVQGVVAGNAPARQAAPAGAPSGALNAGGTPIAGLPPGGDVTHDPFAGFDQFEVWSPNQDLWGNWYDPTPSAGGYVVAPGIPMGDTSFDPFQGFEQFES